MSIFTQRLSALRAQGDQALLKGGLIGLEKETLRVSPEGKLSLTPHPAGLGSALCHPYITTDYSEALLELITPPVASAREALGFLHETQQYVYSQLEHDEFLWATSMPCVVAGESSIPLARYGSSNAGQMKTVYRRGLGHRYGRVMQVIAGIHFNYSVSEGFWPAYLKLLGKEGSLQDFVNEHAFGQLRNLQRLGWLIPYLFGASPAICKSFLQFEPTTLDEFDEYTYYSPYATSLRMGDIGYQNNKENETGVNVSYDSLRAYSHSLQEAISTPCREYEKIGVQVEGKYLQLNVNRLQIENEYYSTVRPKQITSTYEKPVHALQRRGVRYVELRSVDVNVYSSEGVDEPQLYFLEALMLYALMSDSPPISEAEHKEVNHNEMTVAHNGRQPGLVLQYHGRERSMQEWALAVMDEMAGLCRLLDEANGDSCYSDSLQQQRAAILDPSRTPSARILHEMTENGESFYHFSRRMSLMHRKKLMAQQLAEERRQWFAGLATESQRKQLQMEESDTQSFGDFLRDYFRAD